MRRSWSLFRRFLSLPPHPRAVVRHKPKTRLYLESLEERLVPTVVYNSAFGGDTIVWGPNSAGQSQGQVVTSPITNNPGALKDPTVYLIFWGPDWTQDKAAKYAGDAQTILSSNYLSGLTDYGSDGKATYGGYTVDNSTSSLDWGDSTKEIQKTLPNMDSWTKPQKDAPSNGSDLWTGVTSSPIYVVVSDSSSNSAENQPADYKPSGTTTPLAMNQISIWAGANDEDGYTDLLSHELAERISDGGGGIKMNASVPITNEYQNAQISDNEPDQERYTSRLDGKVLVQAYWSISYDAFIIPDGNEQNFYVTPQWTFTGYDAHQQPQYSYGGNDLEIVGDQRGAYYNDDVTIDTLPNGNVQVTLNGESATLSSQITNIEVEAGRGGNTIDILGTPYGISTGVDSEGYDTVTVGNSSARLGHNGLMSNVPSSVYVDGNGSATLNVDDSGDLYGQTVATDGVLGIIYYGSESAIYYKPKTSYSNGSVATLNIFGGSGDDTFNVYNTIPGSYNSLNTGLGNDTVNVYRTSGSFYDYNPGGHDTTNLGLGDTSNLSGFVYVYGPGSTYLFLDDSNDTSARTVTMYAGSLAGLGAGVIEWVSSSSATGGVTEVSITGGSGGNTFNVENTSNFYYGTHLSPGTGNDRVNVYATTGTLYDHNIGGADTTDVGLGSVADINGGVDVDGEGPISLVVDDHLDQGNRTT